MTDLEIRTFRTEREQELRSKRSPLTKILQEQARIQGNKSPNMGFSGIKNHDPAYIGDSPELLGIY